MYTLAFGTPGPTDWVIILVIVLVLFGAKRIPELFRGLGQGMNEFRKAREEFDRELRQAGNDMKSVAQTPPVNQPLQQPANTQPYQATNTQPYPQAANTQPYQPVQSNPQNLPTQTVPGEQPVQQAPQQTQSIETAQVHNRQQP